MGRWRQNDRGMGKMDDNAVSGDVGSDSAAAAAGSCGGADDWRGGGFGTFGEGGRRRRWISL